MNKKIYCKIIVPLFILGIFPIITQAADIDITCAEKTDCIAKPVNTPLFNEKKISPLWSVTKNVKVQNKYKESRNVLLKISDAFGGKLSKKDSLAKILQIIITEVESGKTLWSGTLAELDKENYIKLSTITKNSSRTYRFTVNMPNVGNEYQKKTTKFDMFIGFKTENDGHQGEVKGDRDYRHIFDLCRKYFEDYFKRFR